MKGHKFWLWDDSWLNGVLLATCIPEELNEDLEGSELSMRGIVTFKTRMDVHEQCDVELIPAPQMSNDLLFQLCPRGHL